MSNLLKEKMAELKKVDISREILAKIEDHIETSEPAGWYGISPYRMANEWKLPCNEVLEAFLYATRMGVFDLNWNVKCPSCKGTLEHEKHLSLLKSEAHCEYCKIDINAGFDEHIEVTFNLNDNIKEKEPVKFSQWVQYWDFVEMISEFTVKAGEIWKQTVNLIPGTYYFNTVDMKFMETLFLEGNSSKCVQEVKMVLDDNGLNRVDKEIYCGGEILISIDNKTDDDVECGFIHRKEYPWVSAAQVSSTQSFRDLFSSELISADETFSIKNLVFVFTDIKGSTALYERHGDSNAYFLVKEHFKILTETVRKHNGAVVKTIGDAVMANFMVSQDAIKAVLDMQKAFDEFNKKEDLRDEIIIKVGAHRGPCIAVNSNDRLDYFGRTVNIASRVQDLSTGNDIVLTKSFYEEPGIAEIVKNDYWNTDFYQERLKGINDLYDVVQLKKL